MLLLSCASAPSTPGDGAKEGQAKRELDTTKVASAKVIHLYAHMFHPSSLTIAPGSTIEFINDDPEQHNVTITELGVDQTLATNASFSQTFEKPGTYTISNRFSNGTMTALIKVEP